MQTKNLSLTPSSKDKAKPKTKKNVKVPTNPSVETFKKRYFEFYDDIKISDRQDW